jgi:threonyl-tRNA synthetase
MIKESKDSKEYLDNLRHSCAHLLAAAVIELWPNALRTIGPPIENGFYFDFDFGETKITEEDLPRIEKKMKDIIKSWKEFVREEVSIAEAKKAYKNNEYKLELIDEFSKDSKKLTFYKSGNYSDLCKGGHVENPGKEIGAFKLLKIAGAYWRGSEKNKMLTRIYGTCFSTQKELDEYLTRLAEAEKRDHKKLGKELEIYMQSELVGKGLPIWLPNGEIIRREIEEFAVKTENAAGYLRVITPHLAKKELFEKSGHLPYYAESMYPEMKIDDGKYYLKAMNCPMHHLVFKNSQKSYRDLPYRIAEYGTVYRNELSGTLAGLLRVRMICQNDAHIYCTGEQVEEEFEKVMSMIINYYKTFGLKDYWFRLSLYDPKNKQKYIDEPKSWEHTQEILRKVLKKLKVKYTEALDEAAFYGPKVDIQYRAVSGREETMSTIQLDFAAKKRFELEYNDEKGNKNNEVYVIHRAPLSAHERFIAFLIEHYAGAFPVWLSPTQIVVLPISERFASSADKTYEKLKELLPDTRIKIDSGNEPISKRIRDAQLKKIPYMLVVGEREEKAGTANVRLRTGEQLGELKLEKIAERIKGKIESKALDL